MKKLLLLAFIVYILSIPMAFMFQRAYLLSSPNGSGSPTVSPSETLPLLETIGAIVGGLVFGLIVWLIIIKLAKVLHPHIMSLYAYFLFGFAFFFFLCFALVNLYIPYDLVLIVLTIIGLVLYHKYKYKYFNVFTVFVSTFWAAYIGFTWSPFLVYVAFILLCVYDLIAVFQSNFMMNLARSMFTSRVVPSAFIIDGQVEDMKAKLTENKATKARLLGGGDLIIPGALIATVSIYIGVFYGLMLVCGAMFGLVLNFYILEKRKVGLPALPLLFCSQAAFYGLALLPSEPIWFILSPGIVITSYQMIDTLALRQSKKLKKGGK